VTRSHNIVGCEAIDDPYRRLVDFSPAHGSMVEFRRRGRRKLLRPVLIFAAGVALALIVATLLTAKA